MWTMSAGVICLDWIDLSVVADGRLRGGGRVRDTLAGGPDRLPAAPGVLAAAGG